MTTHKPVRGPHKAAGATNRSKAAADRLANVQPRVVYPVWIGGSWEPELVSIHATKQGAEDVVTHLRGEWCGDEDCYHDDNARVGGSMGIKP